MNITMPTTTTGWVIFGICAVIFAVLFFNSWFTVETSNFAIVQRFGKYLKTAKAGLHFKIPFVDQVAYDETYQIMQLEVKVETITNDKVSVVLDVPVQYFIIDGMEKESAYKLDDAEERIKSLVFDEVRSRVPKLSLDELFNSKDNVATDVRVEINADLKPFGFSIDRVLITDVEPEAKVKAAMNEINAAKKEGEAALQRAQNEQLVQVAQAEGRLKAATLNKDAELIDATAVSKSVEIIGQALHNNVGYLQWQWIHQMKNCPNLIYVPTEAGIPILEAGRGMYADRGQAKV